MSPVRKLVSPRKPVSFVCLAALTICTALLSAQVSQRTGMPPDMAITGRVLDAEGGPVPNVFVTALQKARAPGRSFSLVSGRLRVTANDPGDYRLDGPYAGEFFLFALPRAGQAAPKPAPHERLSVFEGTWARADAAPGDTFRDTCAWMAGGRRHMICRQRSESATGPREQMVIYSYRGRDGTYTITVLLSGGQIWRYEGGPQGDRWIFNRAGDRPDSTQRLRQIVVPTGDSIHFREEISENGGAWRLTDPGEDYKYVRVGGAR